jgi:hypothetical protein
MIVASNFEMANKPDGFARTEISEKQKIVD